MLIIKLKSIHRGSVRTESQSLTRKDGIPSGSEVNLLLRVLTATSTSSIVIDEKYIELLLPLQSKEGVRIYCK